MTSVPFARTPARRWLLPALWTVLTIALALALPGLPWARAAEEASRIAPAWIVIAILANLAILPLWAMEWTLLVPGLHVPFARLLEIVVLTAAVLNSVPMLAGEVSAVALLVTRAGLPRGAALSVLAMDQLLVAFAKVAVLGAAAMVAPMPDWLRGGLLSLVAAFLALLGAMLLLSHRWESIGDRLRGGRSRITALLAVAVAWGAHLEVLRTPRRSLAVASLALAKKGLEVGAVVAIQLAFGLPPSAAAALLVVAALAISTLVPMAPANLGVYEATVFGVYRFLGVAPETAIGLAIVQHLCVLLPALAPGYLMLTWRQFSPGPKRAA